MRSPFAWLAVGASVALAVGAGAFAAAAINAGADDTSGDTLEVHAPEVTCVILNGSILHGCDESTTTTSEAVTSSTAAPTTTASAPSTDTSSPPSTAPTTTSTSTTTTPPASTTSSTTSTVPTTSTTTAPPDGAQFAEDFTGNVGEDRFRHILDHRDGVSSGTWSADHDTNTPCGDPATQRTVHHDQLDEMIYACRDHLMMSMGNVSGYSVVGVCPDVDEVQGCDGFTADSVSWDVTVTNLAGRRWWEVKIVPVDGPDMSVIAWLAEVNGGPAHLPVYPAGSVIVGNGPAGGDFHVHADGQDLNPSEWQHVCDGTEWQLGGAACDSKATRLPFKVTDNRDGTITLNAFGQAWTVAGAFPPVYKVVFAEHAYTPGKDGEFIPGFTNHWDNLRVG